MTGKLTGLALLVFTLSMVLFATVGVCAQPVLSLVKGSTSTAAADAVVVGSGTYLLDLRAGTGGHAVSGLQYYIETVPAATVTYGHAPLIAMGSPFQPSDIILAPSPGAVVSRTTGTTAFFKDSDGDYPAFAGNAIATYQISTRTLTPGTYVFTPVGEELTDATTTIVTTFAAPGAFTLTILADADGDGMPDAFESSNNLNPSSAADASKDDDGDGATNVQEYLAGTHPGNSASVLRAVIQRSATSVRISFAAVANRVYQVESGADLSPSSGWTVLAPDLTRSTDGIVEINDPASANVLTRFYRVRVMR